MEVIGFLFGAVLVLAFFGAVLFVLWLFFVPIKPDPIQRTYRPVEDDDDDDPNWEDHIRHDPYHPGGNQ